MDSDSPRTEPAPAPAPAAVAAPPWKRYARIALPLLVLLVVATYMFWPRIKLGFAINALNSDNPTTFKESRRQLVDAPKIEWVDEAILDAINDTGRSFKVRQACVGVMLDRSRHTLIEKAYQAGGLDTRSVILARWQREPFFEKTYADNPAFRVAETLHEWLGREGDLTRSFALPIVLQLGLDDTMPKLRTMLTRDDDPRGDPAKKRGLLLGAITAVFRFGDCESVPELVRLAKSDPDPIVRMRALQNLQFVAFQKEAACKDTMPEAEMEALVTELFHDASHEVRMAALTNMQRVPTRAMPIQDELLKMVNTPTSDPRESAARREALHVLIHLAQPEFLNALPTYYFDADRHIRASCAMRTEGIESPRLESCLIGLLQNERESDVAFREALKALRLKAGQYKGFSQPLYRLAISREKHQEYMQALGALFAGQPAEGSTREGIVKAWFEWFAGELGLDEEATAAAFAARSAFWESADKKDAAGAAAALAKASDAPADLFRYEQAWLALNE
jgi:hypothetical protein